MKMDKKLREYQLKVLNIFKKNARTFALAGGTALELYYLKHRFSADLDFFSAPYNLKEIDNLVSALKEALGCKIKKEAEFIAANRAKVRFYSVPIKGKDRPLKIDFVEDVLFDKPKIQKIDGLRIYNIMDIYLQKVVAITGTVVREDELGRQIMKGRRESRDAFDIYMLSKKIIPLHKFLNKLPQQLQRGMVHWYRTFSRQDLRLGLLDLDIYDKNFDSKAMIIYLEKEIKQFINEVLGE